MKLERLLRNNMKQNDPLFLIKNKIYKLSELEKELDKLHQYRSLFKIIEKSEKNLEYSGYELLYYYNDIEDECAYSFEMEKLENFLRRLKVPFKRFKKGNRNQIIIEKDDCKLSFVSHYGSIGFEDGLIEFWDFDSEPIGNLTSKNCINILRKRGIKHEG